MKTQIRGEPEARVQNVQIPIRQGHLDGELIIPADPRGLVLFAHGSGSSRFSPRNQFVARVMRRFGFGTLLFDLLTPVEEMEDDVSAHLRFNIPLLAQRLVTATSWTAKQPQTEAFHRGYFGSSTGAAAALVAAAGLGLEIAAVVSRGGRPDLAGSALSRVQSPTLLLVGEYDEEMIRLNKSALGCLSCEKELRIVPGATHRFPEEGALEEVAELAGDWFARHLGARLHL